MRVCIYTHLEIVSLCLFFPPLCGNELLAICFCFFVLFFLALTMLDHIWIIALSGPRNFDSNLASSSPHNFRPVSFVGKLRKEWKEEDQV